MNLIEKIDITIIIAGLISYSIMMASDWNNKLEKTFEVITLVFLAIVIIFNLTLVWLGFIFIPT